MAIGINWAEVWGPVWKAVWTFEEPVPPPVVERNQGAGKSKKRPKRVRYIAEHRGEEYEFASYEALEAFVESKRKTEQKKPRKERKAVRIELAPEYVEEVAEYAPPKLTYTTPPLVALEQIKKLEARMRQQQEDEEEDDEVLLWLM